MEQANLAVAQHLAERGTTVHLVGHSVADRLASHPNVIFHRVRRPLGSYLLGETLLNRRGRAVAEQLRSSDANARVIVNGGNCNWHDVNWVHYVHHAWQPDRIEGPAWVRAKYRWAARKALRDERRVIPNSRFVVTNSCLSERQVVQLLHTPPERVQTIYLGSPSGWVPASPSESAAARKEFQVEPARPVVLFVGALGFDRRKGIDTLLRAWHRLKTRVDWDALLLIAGGGRGADSLRADTDDSVRWLGHSRRIPGLLACADLLVSPVRYEAYGLNVQEALCRNVPALVSRAAGIAERYDEDMEHMLLQDPEDTEELSERLLDWRADPTRWRSAASLLGETLRKRDWAQMAAELVAAVSEEPKR